LIVTGFSFAVHSFRHTKKTSPIEKNGLSFFMIKMQSDPTPPGLRENAMTLANCPTLSRRRQHGQRQITEALFKPFKPFNRFARFNVEIAQTSIRQKAMKSVKQQPTSSEAPDLIEGFNPLLILPASRLCQNIILRPFVWLRINSAEESAFS
jgi:hypothetical protein